jgi:hypothetical protein
MNDELIERLKFFRSSTEDRELRSLLSQCVDALSEWQPIVCGECSETFYAPDCDCTKKEHPLLKFFLKVN